MSKKCFGYLRVSGKGQLNGFGFDRQLEAIQTYASRHNYEIMQVFEEKGISGTTDESSRPAFQQMVSTILKDGVRTILVERVDRLARDLMVQLTFLAYLGSKDVHLIDVGTGIDVVTAMDEDPMKKALIQIMGTFSELEKSLLVKKLRAGRERVRKERGRCEGPKLYGETEKGKETIHKIRAWHRRRRGGFRGLTLREIADRLNVEGVPPKRGGLWTVRMVHRYVG